MSIITGKLCKEKDFKEPEFKNICKHLKEEPRIHRELWANYSIVDTFDKIGLLEKDRLGLGFIEGSKPLCAYFASKGCNVVGADFVRKNEIWSHKNLNQNKICDDTTFYNNVKIIPVQSDKIPKELQTEMFDFMWTINPFIEFDNFPDCFTFITESLKCLKLNGYACFVADYNCLSNDVTIDNAKPLLFRKKDIEHISKMIEPNFKMFPIDYDLGDSGYDFLVDLPPYRQNNHIKLYVKNHIATSIFFVVQRVI